LDLIESEVKTKKHGPPSMALHDFVASTAVQFLGVRGLVRFGAAYRPRGVVAIREIERS